MTDNTKKPDGGQANQNSTPQARTRVFRSFDRNSPSPGANPIKTVTFAPKNTTGGKPAFTPRDNRGSSPRPGSNAQSRRPYNAPARAAGNPAMHHSNRVPGGSSRSNPQRGGGSRFRKEAITDPQSYTDAPLDVPVLNVPPIAPGVVRVIPICGVEWMQTNMTLVEYGDDIIVIDVGSGFKRQDTPGINLSLPDITYLEQNKHRIRAIVITHGHLDHVGAIPYVIERLGMPPIYTREFGAMFIQKRMEEFPHIPKLDIRIVSADMQYVTISPNLKVKFFGLTHSIPDSTGVIIQTPYGGIVSTGDVRVENIDGVVVQEEIDQYAFFKNEKILLATMDSTGAPVAGWATSETLVRENLDRLIGSVEGRLFIGSFSSQVERLMSILNSAKKYGRVVVIDGRSMKSNLEIAKFLGLGEFDNIIPIEDAEKYPPNKQLFLVTGGQGEKYSVLDRVSRDAHRHIKLTPQDTIILSSSVIPGNDFAIDRLKDELYSTGATIIAHADNMVHASGHGKREELRWINSQIPYKFFVPVHGPHWFLHMNAKVAMEKGTPEENIVIPENGTIIEIYNEGNSIRVLPEKAITGKFIVDGAYVGPLHQVVMDDRQTLSENGIFLVVVTIDAKRRELIKTPDIVSRGFIYLRESKELLSRVRMLIRKTCEGYLAERGEIEIDTLKRVLADKVFKYLMQKTQKEPIVIPVVVIV